MAGLPKLLLDASYPMTNDDILVLKENASIEDPIFLRIDITLRQKKLSTSPSFTLSWLTISQSQVKFEHLYLKCKIQVTAKAKIIATNCFFEPYNEKCECAVEIFANSYGNFKNCTFRKASKAGIAVRDRSSVILDNCTFNDNANTSVLVLDKSRADISNCTFKSAERFSIYLYRNSISKVIDSEFLDQNGKAIFMLTNSQAHIINCTFTDCRGGGISIADSSEIFVRSCGFKKIGSSSIHAMKNSKAFVQQCSLATCKGNGVNFEYSTGFVFKCKFNDFDFPAIACFGPKATPVIYDSILYNCHSIAIVSRDCASPKFTKLIISEIKSHGFSISDFSNTIIENCVLKDIGKSPFCVFNGATPTIQNCLIQYNNTDENLLFQTFTKGKVIFKENSIISKNDNFIVKIHNFGIVDRDNFLSNYIHQADSTIENNKDNKNYMNFHKIEISNGRLLSMDDNLNIIVDNKISQLDHPRIFNDIIINNNAEEEDEEEEYEDKKDNNNEKEHNNNNNEEDNKEEEDEKDDDDENNKGQKKKKTLKSAPPKSVQPRLYARTNIPLRNMPNEAVNPIPKTVMMNSSIPQRLPDIHPPSTLPEPLKEVDIELIMTTECQIQDEYSLINNVLTNNNNNNNNQNTEGDVDAATIGQRHLGPCMRCSEGLANHVIIPCGHKVLCQKCAQDCTQVKAQQLPTTATASASVKSIQKVPPQLQSQMTIGFSQYTCPLCDTPIQRCTEEFVEENCVICLDRSCDTIILPCGHRCICYECATQLWTEKKQCPLCQTRVLSFRHMFQIYSEEEKLDAEKKFGSKKDDDDDSSHD